VLEGLTGQRSDLVPAAVGVAVAFCFTSVRRRAQAAVDHILPTREELALFFTDIVGSTEPLANVGDAEWRQLLEQYRKGEEVSGLAVCAAARVMSTGGPGEIVVADTLREVLTSAGLLPSGPRGAQAKGVPGVWRLHAVVTSGAGQQQ
jgi:class 3 adenylate cyclase